MVKLLRQSERRPRRRTAGLRASRATSCGGLALSYSPHPTLTRKGLADPDIRLALVGINLDLQTAAVQAHFGRRDNRFYPVAMLGITAYRIAFDRKKAIVGLLPEPIADAQLWVLPDPSGLNAHASLAGLVVRISRGPQSPRASRPLTLRALCEVALRARLRTVGSVELSSDDSQFR